MRCEKPCEGCALTHGADANAEPHNHIAAMLAVLGPFPFYCHAPMDWRDHLTHHLPPRVLKARGQLKLCAGWRREVAEVAATGYYAHGDATDWSLRRNVARMALIELRRFTTEGATPAEKERAREALRGYMEELVEQRAKFMRGRAVALGLE